RVRQGPSSERKRCCAEHGERHGDRPDRPRPTPDAWRPLERIEQRGHRRVAAARIEREAALQRAHQPPRYLALRTEGQGGRLVSVWKRMLAKHGLPEADAERVLIAARGCCAPSMLLGRHVTGRPEERPLVRER